MLFCVDGATESFALAARKEVFRALARPSLPTAAKKVKRRLNLRFKTPFATCEVIPVLGGNKY